MSDLKFDVVVLDRRHKASKYFKYRVEFPQYHLSRSFTRLDHIGNFSKLYHWFSQQYGIGYDYNTWLHLAKNKSDLLNPYWCFDIDKTNESRYIYIWNDDAMVMFNLVFGGNSA